MTFSTVIPLTYIIFRYDFIDLHGLHISSGLRGHLNHVPNTTPSGLRKHWCHDLHKSANMKKDFSHNEYMSVHNKNTQIMNPQKGY